MSPDLKHFKAAIEAISTAQGVEWCLMAAVVQAESGFRADAFRHEPAFWARYMKKTPQYGGLNPRRYASSYGLAQVMWVVAVEEGFDATLPPEHLFVPELSLDYGCKRLKRCLDWASKFVDATEKGRLLSALAAYNGGRNSAQTPPNPRNIKYALRVWGFLQELVA